jgi:hypothetical protein
MLYRQPPGHSDNEHVIIMDRMTKREHEIARVGITHATFTCPISDDDALVQIGAGLASEGGYRLAIRRTPV